jgi:hypothetical protein
MKGLVFAEFLDMVSTSYSPDVVEDILDDCDLQSGGAYTSVGTYDHQEMHALITALSDRVGVPGQDLTVAFGQHLFGVFLAKYPEFFVGVDSAPEFLSLVDGYVHLEVQKLYPDAELPSFECVQVDPDTMTMTYRSSRGFEDLAAGLLAGCVAHFESPWEIERYSGGPDTTVFTLRRAH